MNRANATSTSASTPTQDMNIELDAQIPGLKIYTQICLCYPMAETSSASASKQNEIIGILRQGLEQVSQNFPWMAGQIINEGSCEGNTGVFKVVPLERTPRLRIKDATNDPSYPTMHALREADFPSRMLNEKLIAPRMTLPGSPDEPETDPAPVFMLQATFIKGGLLLTFVSEHNAMDMVGHGQAMHLLSKACRNDEYTAEELSSGNLAGKNLIPLLEGSYEPGPELEDQILGQPLPIETTGSVTDGLPGPELEPPKSIWADFIFSHASLTKLKAEAMQSLTSQAGFVSTDDSLSALVWKCVARARLLRLEQPQRTTFARAVDVRRYFGIPSTYAGFMQNMSYHEQNLKEIAEAPLGAIASQLRHGVDPKSSRLAYKSRALATYLNQTPDKSRVSFTAKMDFSTDIAFSSWSKINAYELDFGLSLGKPEAIRRPRFQPLESLMYSMPKRSDGEIALAICLRDKDMEILKSDEDFARYGRYIG